MPSIPRFELFVAAALILLVVPGPAVLYIVARSLDQGRLAGVVSALGVGVGNGVHAAGAALGLSALLASSAVAFGVVKYLGGAYLIYLGLRRLFGYDDEPTSAVERRRLPRTFLQGVVVAVLNPKTALFFLAFLPQFVVVGAGAVWIQALVLGLVFVGLGICTDSIYALVTGTAGGWLKRRTRLVAGQRYVSGAVYLTLGVATTVSGAGED